MKKKISALLLDVDGVLSRGGVALPHVSSFLKKLTLPFALLTNGGGTSEVEKALQFSRALDVTLSPEQIILSHSPMQALPEAAKRLRTLVLGGKGLACLHVAQHYYGFESAVAGLQLMQKYPMLHPGSSGGYPKSLRTAAVEEMAAIEQVLVMHDPEDWRGDAQLVLDACLSGNLPDLYLSNSDFTYAGAHVHGRLAQGAFHTFLESLHARAFDGKPLPVTKRFGKPHGVAFKYAHDVLCRLAGEASSSSIPVDEVLMVGDNPDSDIRGACGAGMQTCLVRTGVWDGVRELPQDCRVDHIVDHVGEVYSKLS